MPAMPVSILRARSASCCSCRSGLGEDSARAARLALRRLRCSLWSCWPAEFVIGNLLRCSAASPIVRSMTWPYWLPRVPTLPCRSPGSRRSSGLPQRGPAIPFDSPVAAMRPSSRSSRWTAGARFVHAFTAAAWRCAPPILQLRVRSPAIPGCSIARRACKASDPLLARPFPGGRNCRRLLAERA